MNKDLILREHLAIERTRLSNETTLLAYIRTGLYFIVAGSTLGHLIETVFWNIAGPPLIIIGVAIMTLGVVRFRKVSKNIEISRANIGNSSDSFIRAARGENV